VRVISATNKNHITKMGNVPRYRTHVKRLVSVYQRVKFKKKRIETR